MTLKPISLGRSYSHTFTSVELATILLHLRLAKGEIEESDLPEEARILLPDILARISRDVEIFRELDPRGLGMDHHDRRGWPTK